LRGSPLSKCSISNREGAKGQQQHQEEEEDEESYASSSPSSSETTTNTCREVFQKGLLNFATMTLMSTLPAIIAISFYSWHYPKIFQQLMPHIII